MWSAKYQRQSVSIMKQPATKIRSLTGRPSKIENQAYMKFFYIAFFLLSVIVGYGQDYCNPAQRPNGVGQGGFKIVGNAMGCTPFDVTVEKTVGQSALYLYDYKGGDPTKTPYQPISATTFRYTKAGVYRILQLISNGSGAVACQEVRVFNPPNFTAKACSGRKVQVTIPNDSTTQDYEEFTINWGGAITSKVTKSTNMTASYSYPATTNTASITVTGSVAGQSLNCSKPAVALVLSITNLSAVAIRKVTVRNDGFVDVLVKGSQGATAEIQIKDVGGAFRNTGQLMTSNDTNTITVRNIDALKNSYCFRLSANDGCDNAATTSDEVCSVNLEVVAKNGQNDLSWQEYPTTTGAATFQNYRFTRNGAITGSPITNRQTTTQSDRNIVCNEQFCYQMTVALTGGAESVSPLRCVKAISDETPSLVQNAFVSVLEDEQKIEIRADAPLSGATPAKFKTILLRADNGKDFKEIATKSNSLTFVDEIANPAAQSYCYQLQYENSCGNRSQPTAPICSIYLSSKNTSTIDWSSETPFLTPVNRYELEILDEQGGLVNQIPQGGNTTFDPSLYNPDQQLFRYRILAFAQGTPRISYSNFFVFTRDPVIFMPDAFSPNGDTVNDIFAPKGQFVDKSRLIIYNRWGQVLHETSNVTEGWDGTIGGQPAVEGTYVYRLEITDSLGQSFVKTGTVFLVR